MTNLEFQGKEKTRKDILAQIRKRAEVTSYHQYLAAFSVHNMHLFESCSPKSAGAAIYMWGCIVDSNDVTYKEVAELFDVSSGTVRKYSKKIRLQNLPYEAPCPHCGSVPLEVNKNGEWGFNPPLTVKYRDAFCRRCSHHFKKGSWEVQPY